MSTAMITANAAERMIMSVLRSIGNMIHEWLKNLTKKEVKGWKASPFRAGRRSDACICRDWCSCLRIRNSISRDVSTRCSRCGSRCDRSTM